MNDPIWLMIGVLIGILIGWFIARKLWVEPQESQEDAAILRQRVNDLEARNLELQTAQNRDAQRMATLQDQLNAAEASASSTQSRTQTEMTGARSASMAATSGAMGASSMSSGSSTAEATRASADASRMESGATGADTMGADTMGASRSASDTMRSSRMESGATGSSTMGTVTMESGTMGSGMMESGTRENVTSGSAYTNRDIAAELQSSDSVDELQDKEEDLGIDAESLPTQETPDDGTHVREAVSATVVEGPGFTMQEVTEEETTYTESAVTQSRQFALGDAGPAGAAPDDPDDLTVIKGIGPVISRRLNEAGIHTFGALAQLSAEDLRDAIGDVISTLADEEAILVEARRLANNREQQG